MKYYNIYNHSSPSADSRRVIVVSYKRKYMHKVLVNCLFKLAQGKSEFHIWQMNLMFKANCTGK